MNYERMKISEFISRINEFVRTSVLYAEGNSLQANKDVLILHDIYTSEPIENFKWTLSCADVEDIMINLSSQLSKPTLDDYIEAINYYIENDAFIDKENPENKPQGGYKIWGGGQPEKG